LSIVSSSTVFEIAKHFTFGSLLGIAATIFRFSGINMHFKVPSEKNCSNISLLMVVVAERRTAVSDCLDRLMVGVVCRTATTAAIKRMEKTHHVASVRKSLSNFAPGDSLEWVD